MKLKCSATEVSAPGRRVRVEAVAEAVALAA
ncbi:BnaC02g20090D [Brassica napus]|uniref:BnaC02g20090D protein n=1 Tax=Brassica napus TaxID=3708 RepID=A0A078F8P5_BRANA|nr:BnaC02g20090D [Brassica napus]